MFEKEKQEVFVLFMLNRRVKLGKYDGSNFILITVFGFDNNQNHFGVAGIETSVWCGDRLYLLNSDTEKFSELVSIDDVIENRLVGYFAEGFEIL